MAYFLGRDVKLAITTEHKALGIEINSSDEAVVAGVVGNLLADADLIKSREWPNDGDFDESVDNFDSVAITNNLANVTVSSITKTDDTAVFDLTFSNAPAAGETIVITDADGTQTTYTAHASTQSGTTFSRAGATASVVDALQTSVETTSQKFTLSQPSATVLRFTTSQDRDLGIVLSGDEKNVLDDVTGIDISTETVDEDIAYFGQRTALKAEIKKATTISITRKRSSTDFSVLFNQARGGVRTFTDSNQTTESIDNVTGATDSAGVTANLAGIDNHDRQPDRNYGYRVHLMLKEGSEVMSIRNCCFQEYSITLNADAVQEETLVFYSLVDPIIASAGTTAVVAASDF
tara:strand:+ start:685 stop:1731 length:1047 start_codon:yes stop_codon:yes gene_type:complete